MLTAKPNAQQRGASHLVEHLEAITESTSDAILTSTSTGDILSWNGAAERIFGYTREEAVGKNLRIIIPERFHKLHEAGMKRVREGGEQRVIGRPVELAGVRKNGEEFPLELSLSTWQTDEGRFFGGIIRDITVRKQAETELKDSINRFQSITETANDAITTADAQGIVLTWNKAAEKMFGYTGEEMCGQKLSIIVPEKFRKLHEEGIKRVTGGGEKHVIGKTVELEGLHKDGHTFPLELSLSTWASGESRFYCGIIRDITERKRVEAEIKEAESRFRSIAESATDAIVSANQEGLIVSWNQAAEQIFGYKAKEVTGKPLTVMIPGKFKELHEQGIKRVVKGGERHVIGKTVELSGLHKKGHEFPIELSLSTWEAGGERFFSGIIRDITQRKKAEEELNQSREQLSQRAEKLKTLHEEVKQKNEQLEALSNKLAKYLSRQVYTSIFEGKRDVKIESYRKKLTVFFSDIQGFTELTDRVESEVLTSVLNKYLNEMSKIALDCGGTIDKYIGDAIMIFFGDPETLGEKQDAIACVKMALKMRDRLEELRMEWDALGISTPLRVRMGINTGYCTVGNFGSEERLDYTIVGGPVNLASRLEGAADVDQILISQDTFALVKEVVACEKKDEIKVKGQAYPVQTYQVVNLISELKTDEEKLMAALKGFNISIDFHEISYSDKLYAKELLQKALAKFK